MIHVPFDRPTEHIKLFAPDESLVTTYRGEGDAWGYTPEAPYGHDGWCPPGHYILGAVQRFDTPIASEGYGQIPILDMSADVAQQLVAAGKAHWSGLDLVIGGLAARIGQLAKYGRSGIMDHRGGSNAVDPYADYQQLCKTFGCTRKYNIEWRHFADWLDAHRSGHTVVFTIVGDPVRLPK